MSTGDPKIWDKVFCKSTSIGGSSGAGSFGITTNSHVNSQVNPGVSLDNATINGTPIDVQGMTVWNLITNLDESDICDKLERMSDNGIKTIREQLDTVKTLIERELFRRT